MNNGLVSVIVPLYNCEHRILLCINSILKQTYENIEVIVIDDGSTDNSLRVLKEGIKDSRLKVFTQENHGLSYTRNRGIEIALSGDNDGWITFVDSDDYIDPNTIMDCLNYSELNKIDLIHYGFCRLRENGELEHNFCNNEEKNISKIEAFEMFFKGRFGAKFVNGNWPVLVTSGLFRKKIIKDRHVLFNENMQSGEDALFVSTYLDFCKQIRIVNKPYYTWWSNYGSLSSVTGKKTISKFVYCECTILWSVMLERIKQFGNELGEIYAAWIISYFADFLNKSARVNLNYQDTKEYLDIILSQKDVLDFVYKQKLHFLHERISCLMLKSKSVFISYIVIKLMRLLNGYWKKKNRIPNKV